MLAYIVAIRRAGPEEKAEAECYGAMVSLGPYTFIEGSLTDGGAFMLTVLVNACLCPSAFDILM